MGPLCHYVPTVTHRTMVRGWRQCCSCWMLVTTNNVSNQLHTQQHSSSSTHLPAAQHQGLPWGHHDLLLLQKCFRPYQSTSTDLLTGVPEERAAWEQPRPPEQAWPALIRTQAPTLRITRPSLPRPSIADCLLQWGRGYWECAAQKQGHTDVPNL